LGGITTRDKRKIDDPGFYARIGKMGGKATLAKHGALGFYQRIGAMGTKANAQAHDTAHVADSGAEGGATVAALVEEGRAARGK
jgi:general stress protein YciG